MIAVQKLEHITLRVRDLEESRRFYTEVLDLRDGPRPPFEFPGAWLYVGETAVIHLIGGRPSDIETTGPVDHVGLVATDPAAFVKRCNDRDIPFQQREVPGLGLRQIFIHDPNGVLLELNFPME